ncbi:(2Fe-2S)-binding protein [Candidatus Micrarchaeota archaeon]|nr:(2Fe-2S)-binding protein [Candidatus Micrarchaeota archaeon]
MIFTPIIRHRLPFEEGLARAEKDNRIICGVGPGLFLDRDISPLATGTIAAHVRPTEKLGKTIERIYRKAGQRWVFHVPKEYRQEKNALLFVHHPFWVLEVDGINRVIHSEQARVHRFPSFPSCSGWYELDEKDHLPISASVSSETFRLIVRGGRRKNFWVDIGHLRRASTYVGPIVKQYSGYRSPYDSNLTHLHIHRFAMDWNPSWKCILIGIRFRAREKIKNRIALEGLPEEHPVRRLRGLGEDQIAGVIVHSDQKTQQIPVLKGSTLNCLRGYSDIRFSCEAGYCGVCLVEVLRGKENLSKPGIMELKELASFPDPDNKRLICLAKIKEGEVEVRVSEKNVDS